MINRKIILRSLGIMLLVTNMVFICIILLAAISTPRYGVAAISAAKANKFLAEKNFSQASRLYTEAAEVVKNLESKSGYYASAAHTFLKNREYEQALASVINAIENNPVNGSPYQILEWITQEIPLENDISGHYNRLQKIENINMVRLEYILSRYTQRTDENRQKQFVGSIEPPLGELIKTWF